MALSLPVVSVELSHPSLAMLEENVAVARDFESMPVAEMDDPRARLAGAGPLWASDLRGHEDWG